MMMIVPSSITRMEGKVKGEYGRISGEEERNANHGGMMQPSQQHVPVIP